MKLNKIFEKSDKVMKFLSSGLYISSYNVIFNVIFLNKNFYLSHLFFVDGFKLSHYILNWHFFEDEYK